MDKESAADSAMDFGVGLDLLSGSLIGIVLELIVLALFFGSSLVGRLLFRRPWTVEARNLDDPERSVAYAVEGYRRAGDAVTELASAIAAAGPRSGSPPASARALPRPEA